MTEQWTNRLSQDAYIEPSMPPLSHIRHKVLITHDFDESVIHGQTDVPTDQRMDGEMLLQGCNDASKSFTDRYLPVYGQVCTCIRLHTHQQVQVRGYTVTHARRRIILLIEGARKRAQGKNSTLDIFFPFFSSFSFHKKQK